MMPDIRHGHADVLGEGPGAVHPDADGVLAKMTAAREAVAAAPADNVTFRADDLSRVKIIHVRAGSHHFTDKFMPHNHRHRDRLLRPRIPFIDMQVRSADSCLVDFDENIIDANFRLRDILEPQSPL